MQTITIDTLKNQGFAISIIVFPVMLLAGFLMHQNLLLMEPLQTAQQLVVRFRNNPIYHVGHLIVMLSVPFIIIAMIGIMNLLQEKGRVWGFWGGIISVFGAFILAVDKGALSLVMSAFDTLPDHQFAGLIPYLQVIVDKAGFLFLSCGCYLCYLSVQLSRPLD